MKLNKKITVLSTISILLLMLFTLNACDNVDNKNKQLTKSEEPQKPKIPEVVMEDLGDASSYDMARFQFQGYFEESEQKEIWSVKVDSSDLRLVLSKDELYKDGFGNLSNNMSRSPDNRYVMLIQNPDHGELSEPDKGSNARVLYDLKTRERTVIIARGAVRPSIRWTEDSRFVLFYSWSYEDSEAYLYQYDVIEKKLEKGPEVHSYEFYPIKNDTEFVAITKQGFVLYDWSGKKLKEEVKLADEISTRQHAVSRNGQYLVYKLNKGVAPAFNIINIEKQKIVYSFKGRSMNFMLDYKGKYLYYLGFDGYERLNIKSKTKEIIIPSLNYLNGYVNFILYNDKER